MLFTRSHFTTRLRVLMVLGLGAMAGIASAHIVFDPPQAVAGTYHRAQLRVTHGCDGEATQALIAYVPLEMQGAKPQAKPGWRITTQNTRLAKPYDNHGKTVLEDVSEIRWEATHADQALPDDQFDEFAFMVKLSQPGLLSVRVVQICATKRNDWSQVPSTRSNKYPAATLDVVPPANMSPHHHH